MSKYLILIIVFATLLGCENKHAPLYKAVEEMERSYPKEFLKEFVQEQKEKEGKSYLGHFRHVIFYKNKRLKSPIDYELVTYFNGCSLN